MTEQPKYTPAQAKELQEVLGIDVGIEAQLEAAQRAAMTSGTNPYEGSDPTLDALLVYGMEARASVRKESDSF